MSRLEGSVYDQIVTEVARAHPTDRDVLGAEWPRGSHLGDASGLADAFVSDEEVRRALEAWDVLEARYSGYSRGRRCLAGDAGDGDPLLAGLHTGAEVVLADLSPRAREAYGAAPELDTMCRECGLVWDYRDLDEVWNAEERLEEAADLTDPPGDCLSCGGLATSIRPLDRRGALHLLAEGIIDPFSGERHVVPLTEEVRAMFPTLLAEAPPALREALFARLGRRPPRTG